MGDAAGNDHRRFLRECADRTRMLGTAHCAVAQDTNLPDVPPEAVNAVMRGQLDFTRDRCWLSVDTATVIVADGSQLFERQAADRWTRQWLPDGSGVIIDPRWLLRLLTTACRAAHANGPDTYEVTYDRQTVARTIVPGLAPSWVSLTGTVAVDNGRIARTSARFATATGDLYWETRLSLSDFGAPVTFVPPPSESVIEHTDYLQEMVGGEAARQTGPTKKTVIRDTTPQAG